MDNGLEQAEKKARAIIGGDEARPDDVMQIEKTLRNARRFGLARKVLARCARRADVAGNAKLRRQIGQKLALCTYKDPDLQDSAKLDDALDILKGIDDLETTADQETLGLAGAIYKRRWELLAQERMLETALSYYYRGYQVGIASDYGYTAINAAFLLDRLADLESVAGQPPDLRTATPEKRSDLATRIRTEVVAALPALAEKEAWLYDTWWFLVTVGEAAFGLADYDAAREWLLRAAALKNVPDWEQESSARQLAALWHLMGTAAERAGRQIDPRARALLCEFLGNNVAALDSVLRGKIGLALSGGGFRASFYHIGMLARLADLDLLRHVEYLSCVSGGSIIGAHYYLEVQALLERKADRDIAREDYIEIVKRIEHDFFAGVATNIRTRIGAEWLTNLKMIFVPSYSRTMRAGELYESEIFSRVPDGKGGNSRWMDDLRVAPKDESSTFSPKDINWRRAAKVPILVLNATSLNTGHNWQFTASWMGEPPAGINAEVDANYRLRRMYYDEAPPQYKRVRLGHAVAASACVPGLFEPLAFPDLYERFAPGEDKKLRPVVRLVDGGVHDNQGVAALLEQSCSVMLVSDASGQMDDADFPSNGLLGVPLRANSILQARIRVSQFEDLASRRRGGLLKGLMFVHLKKDLETLSVNWVETQEPAPTPSADPRLPYGVQRHVQRGLAAIRTDLDSFSEVEACALMADGYLMTEHSLRAPLLGFPVENASRTVGWHFLEAQQLLEDRRLTTPFTRQLKVASEIFFKVWILVRQLQILAGFLTFAILGLLCYLAWLKRNDALFTLSVKGAVIAMALGLLTAAGLGWVAKMVNYRKTATDVLIGVGSATLGWLLARLHLHVFDKMFLRQGRLKNLFGRDDAPLDNVQRNAP